MQVVVLGGTRWGGVILKGYTDLSRFAPQHVSYLEFLAMAAINDSLHIALLSQCDADIHYDHGIGCHKPCQE